MKNRTLFILFLIIFQLINIVLFKSLFFVLLSLCFTLFLYDKFNLRNIALLLTLLLYFFGVFYNDFGNWVDEFRDSRGMESRIMQYKFLLANIDQISLFKSDINFLPDFSEYTNSNISNIHIVANFHNHYINILINYGLIIFFLHLYFIFYLTKFSSYKMKIANPFFCYFMVIFIHSLFFVDSYKSFFIFSSFLIIFINKILHIYDHKP
jgi:hypothetical protein